MARDTAVKRRMWMIAPPLLGGFAILFFAASNPAEPAKTDSPPEPRVVRVIEATATPIVPKAIGFGVVEPARSWSVVPDVSGRIVYAHPQFVRGGILRKGDVVIRIDPSNYQLEVNRLRADIKSIDAKIAELKQSEANTQALLELEKQALAVAERELKRQEDLKARSTVGSQAAIDSSTRAAITLRSSVTSLENSLKLIPAQVSAQESAKEVSQARLAAAELDLKRVEIKAPYAGAVAAASADVSQFVTAGASLGSVDSIATAEATARFPSATMREFGRLAMRGVDRTTDEAARSTDFNQIVKRLGIKAIASLEVGSAAALGGGATPRWDANVVRISEEIDAATRSFGVIVSIDDPYGQARAGRRPALIKGSFVKIELFARPVDGLVLAPRSALRVSRTGDAEILVLSADNKLERRVVRLAATMADVAAIESGVAVGERIVVTDLAPAIVGETLKPVLDEAAARKLVAAAGPPAGAAAAAKQGEASE